MDWKPTVGSHPEQKSFRGKSYPLILDGGGCAREVGLQWIQENADELRVQMQEHGALLLRNFSLEGASCFEEALDRAAFVNMPYVGGAAPRSQVTTGRILTANESPPSEVIPFHHEMAQVPNPPAYVFFFCDIPSAVGGATSIVHSGKVCETFEKLAPTFAKQVEEEGVRYVRVMPEDDDPTSPIGRSWKNTFQVQTRDEAEARMKSLGTEWEWLADGDLKTITRVVPAIRTDERTGLKVFFNSMVAAYTGWTDRRNTGETAVQCGGGDPVNGAALLQTKEAMAREAVSIPWQQGDMLWVDNGLVMHARQPYEGARRILASIAVG